MAVDRSSVKSRDSPQSMKRNHTASGSWQVELVADSDETSTLSPMLRCGESTRQVEDIKWIERI